MEVRLIDMGLVSCRIGFEYIVLFLLMIGDVEVK